MRICTFCQQPMPEHPGRGRKPTAHPSCFELHKSFVYLYVYAQLHFVGPDRKELVCAVDDVRQLVVPVARAGARLQGLVPADDGNDAARLQVDIDDVLMGPPDSGAS